MILIIFPGASDPYTFSQSQNKYILKDKYEDLSKHAYLHGYSQVILPSYHGHSSKTSSKLLTLDTTIETMQNVLEILENEKKSYEVLAISYGTFAFIELLKRQKFQYLKKVIVWGAGSCDSYYKNMIVEEKKNTKRLLDSGTRIKEDIFYDIQPFVVSVSELSQIDLKYNVLICGGGNDEFYSESLRQSLLKVNKNDNIILPSRIKNCAHSIDVSNKECLNLIFGEDYERKR